MKIVFTADVHLSQDHPQRMEALEAVADLARDRGADLVIAGDLFDNDVEAERLGPLLRRIFESIPGRTILVSGNHDRRSYRLGRDFGLKTVTFGEGPPEVLVDRGYRLVALPFTEEPFDNLAPHLARLAEGREPSILVLHCTLDFPDLDPASFGNEERSRYLPVSSSVLGQLGFRWIIAGHFHSRFRVQEIGPETTFIYPGSPVAITAREEGRRHAGLLDLSNNTLERVPLDTHHLVRITATVRPGDEEETLSRVKQALAAEAHPKARSSLRIEGFVQWDETRFRESIQELADLHGVNEVEVTSIGVSHLQEHPLYQKFMSHLEEGGAEPDQKVRLQEAFLRVFSEHLARRR